MRVDPIHVHVGNISRLKDNGGERSAVAKAAYNAGVTLWNEYEQQFSNFSYREDVIYSEIFAPEGAPDWASERERLWNLVDTTARRKDARLAKSIDAAIPRPIPRQNWPELAAAYAKLFVQEGMVADAAVHEDGTDHNPHVHVLLTVNALKPDGFASKLGLVDTKRFVTLARTGWEQLCNDVLASGTSGLRVDARSYKKQGVDKIPTRHRGPNRLERQAQRAYAKEVREEKTMSREPKAFERYSFPHLVEHEDFPFLDGREPPDLTPEQREEFGRWEVHHEREAERAAEAALRDKSVPQWFKERTEPKRDGLNDVRPDLEPRALEAELDPTEPWAQPALRELDPFMRDFQEQRTAYEKDLWQRAINLNRTRQENELIKRAEAVSPEMTRQVKEVLFNQRIAQLREQDDAARLDRLEARLGPALREPFEDWAREAWPDRDRYPLPGPDRELASPSEVARQQDLMLDDYERDQGDRDR